MSQNSDDLAIWNTCDGSRKKITIRIISKSFICYNGRKRFTTVNQHFSSWYRLQRILVSHSCLPVVWNVRSLQKSNKLTFLFWFSKEEHMKKKIQDWQTVHCHSVKWNLQKQSDNEPLKQEYWNFKRAVCLCRRQSAQKVKLEKKCRLVTTPEWYQDTVIYP